jgi:hypothetical protein
VSAKVPLPLLVVTPFSKKQPLKKGRWIPLLAGVVALLVIAGIASASHRHLTAGADR